MTEQQAVIATRLAECEGRIARGWTDMAEAMVCIRDEELYRGAEYDDFQTYCEERWGYKKSQVYRLMNAADTLKLLEDSPIGEIAPANEAQVRPLTKLPIDKRADAWHEAVKTAPKADDGHPMVTAKHVEGVVARLTPQEAKRPAPPPPTQDTIDLRELHKIGRIVKTLAYSGDAALDRFGAEALGEDVLFAAQWFADLWHEHRGDVDVSIPLQDGSFYHPSAEDVALWQKSYPALDVMAELRKCAAWNDANPSKRKTHKGIKKHIVYWLGNQKPDPANNGAEDRVVML